MLWTGQAVIDHLIEYFVPFPGAPIPRWLPVAQWQVHLVRHCRAKADHYSIRGLCRDFGWAKSSHYRRVKKSGGMVADSLNLKEGLRR